MVSFRKGLRDVTNTLLQKQTRLVLQFSGHSSHGLVSHAACMWKDSISKTQTNVPNQSFWSFKHLTFSVIQNGIQHIGQTLQFIASNTACLRAIKTSVYFVHTEHG